MCIKAPFNLSIASCLYETPYKMRLQSRTLKGTYSSSYLYNLI